ncbi:unnamed protein product [Mytilus coruscus]|uniref:Peptidase A2 domain-containing protein n=1 Tax=Mytilus coruscus TaxID=42192 RepID=A0A6J8CSY4_MYTCO|nr:unnamed protein product [Mytilus coruscus]
MPQNKNRNSQGGGYQQRNYQNGQRGYNNQNKNFGQGNRNFNQRNNNFGKPVEVGLRGRSQAKSEWPKSIKINESLANNEGLFVRAKINDKYLAFLVDTGANVTILSKKFIDEINPSLLPKINPVNINLITAIGDSAPFIGQVDVEICLGDHIYHHNVLVADISNEGIIGMDSLVTHDCDVLLSQNKKFILKYADKAKPLYKVTEKNQKFVWTDDCQQSFEELKNTLISAPILAYPTREDLFILDTDASNVGMGAVLSQLQDGVEKNPEGQLARWFVVLASYDFKIEHRAGRSHNNADALSRRPCYNKECPHCARAEINYELVPTHKNVLTVEKCNDNVTVSESCRNVQDVSDKQSVITTSISCINEDGPNMTGDETCHKVKSHVIHNKFKSKGPDKNPDVFPVQSKIVRVCTRSKDYGCSQNEKDNQLKK